MLSLGWTHDVLKFWFDEAGSDRWFGKDAMFDDTVRRRFRAVHEALATCDKTSSWPIPGPRWRP